MNSSETERLADARDALRRGDGAAARTALEPARSDVQDAEVLECLARAAYLERRFDDAIADWELAYAGYRERRDHVGAVRVARTIAYMYGSIVGDAAVMAGWLGRAQTLLGSAAASAESGWVALARGMFEPDRARKDRCFTDALDVARSFDDADLEFLALAYLGASYVHADRTEEGMSLLDEALAAVAGRDVDDFVVLQEIFCQLFSACEHAHDVTRADQWIRIGEAIAARRKVPAISAFCRTHYGGILTAAGRWPEADLALTEAIELWTLGRHRMRASALIRLADLRLRQGRLEEAEQLLQGLDTNTDAAHPLAAVHLARGESGRAREVIERALVEIDRTSTAAVPLLAVLADAHLAAGDVERAVAAVMELDSCAATHANDYLMAVAARARGRAGLAAGRPEALACLRQAVAGFARTQLPMELSRARLELAAALAGDDREVAIAEARAALHGFERLHAAHDADEAAALLRSLGVNVSTAGKRASDVLSKREDEVLALLGHGYSNAEISDRLYISRKTVEHHVGNILAKLGLRSRSEAAAYATRSK